MAANEHPAQDPLPGILASASSLAALERTKSLVLRAWIVAGIFFMALPGTLLGFSNLVAISAHHGAIGLSPAWMEGHGHAQVFGWIGSFVLGIGFYSQPTAGEEISSHSAPMPAVLYFLEGEAAVQLGQETVYAHPGSFVFMLPMLSHAISAKLPTRMLLVQIKTAHYSGSRA